MTRPFRRPSTKPNPALNALQTGLADIFLQKTKHTDSAVGQVVRAIEHGGSDGYFKDEVQASAHFEVLALDVAWVGPGPEQRWLEEGHQVCFCRYARKDEDRASPANWYARALRAYFSGDDSQSLLSFPGVYTNDQIIQILWLDGGSRAPKVANRKRIRGQLSAADKYTWSDVFRPRDGKELNLKQWKRRFQKYRRLVCSYLQEDVPNLDLSGTMLAWVYVSPGTGDGGDGGPPEWGASVFLLFRVAKRKKAQGETQSVRALLSNLLRCLKFIAPSTVGYRRSKQNVAQVLAHEFKNLNHGVSLVSGQMRQQMLAADAAPRISRKYLRNVTAQLEILNLGVQASSAFCIATSWLFGVKAGGMELHADPNAVHFRHALYLTIRMVEGLNPNQHWILEGIPPLAEIIHYFKQQGVRATQVDDLVENRAIAVMMFFAIEAVRNMRRRTEDQASILVSVRSEGACVFLCQSAPERPPVVAKESGSISSLMTEVRRYNTVPLIDIRPIVTPVTIKQLENGFVEVKRETTFVVHRIPTMVSLVEPVSHLQ